MSMNENKAKLLKEYDEQIAHINSICTKGTAPEVEAALARLAEIEKDYRNLHEKEVFSELISPEEAIIKHTFETIAHRKLTEEGRMTGVEKSNKVVQIDLKRYFDYHKLPTAWYYEVQALNKRLVIKVLRSVCDGDKLTRRLKQIDDSYLMDKHAEEIALGKTPDSNTQVVAHIQRILDMIAPESGRVTSRDLNFLMGSYTKRTSVDSLKLTCSKHGMLLSLLTNVFHNVLTGKGYDVDYQRKKFTEINAAPAQPGEIQKSSKPEENKNSKEEVAA